MSKAERALFRTIAESLINAARPGSTGYRRSLGAVKNTWDAEDLGEKFLTFVKRAFPLNVFRLSAVEGTGGTAGNVRIRAYLVK